MPKIGFHGHVEEAYLRFIDKKLKEKRAAMGINPLIRDIYVKVESQEAKSGAPLSPILSPYGLNVSEFVNNFNKQSEQSEYGAGVKIPTVINVFENKTLKFYFTTLYSYYIISNNNNKYKALKLKDIYKKLLLVFKSKEIGKPRVWSEKHELYSKTETKLINLFTLGRRKQNTKKKKRLLRVKKQPQLLKKNEKLNLKSTYKIMLATLQSNRILLYMKLKHFLKGGLFRPAVKEINSFEEFIRRHCDLFLGNYNKNICKYKMREIKIKKKHIRNYTKWQKHKKYFKELKDKTKHKLKGNEKREIFKHVYINH